MLEKNVGSIREQKIILDHPNKYRKIFLMNYDDIDNTKVTCDVSLNCSSMFLILLNVKDNEKL